MICGRLVSLALAIAASLALVSCSDKSKKLAPNPPNIFAAYAEPAWHSGGRVIVFNHTPLVRRFRDPGTGQYVYVFAESLHGLWMVNSDGTGLRRLLPFPLVRPDWDSAGTALAYEQSDCHLDRGGLRLCT